MFTLLAPLGLIALAALVLPILIHLIRRSERKEVDFAALRWLSERNRPRKQLRLQDHVLLVLRLLLVAVLALLLALPVRKLQGEPGAVWVGVSPEVDAATAHAAISEATAEWHWLAPGFPSLDAPTPIVETSPTSLIREADAMLPPDTRLRLVVPQTLRGLDAERLRLGHAVEWQPLAGRPLPPLSTTPAPALHVAIRGAATHEDERTVVRALIKAWQASGREASLDASNNAIAADTALLFWLGGQPDDVTLHWINDGGRVIASSIVKPQGVVVLTNAEGLPLLHDATLGRGHLFALPAALTPQTLPSLLDPMFPQHLLAQVEPPRPQTSTAAAAAVSPQKIEPAPRGPVVPLDRWIALVAAGLFLLERLWATRRQSVLA